MHSLVILFREFLQTDYYYWAGKMKNLNSICLLSLIYFCHPNEFYCKTGPVTASGNITCTF